MLGSPFPLPLDSIFLCAPSRVDALREALMPWRGGALSQFEGAKATGRLGQPLSATDARLVQLHPLRPYVAGKS